MPRFRPRISILTALLLMTIVGLAIVVALQWREVGPLRRELKALRAEVGVLDIDDESKVHVVQVKEPGNFRWNWRIWLPKGYDYWFCASQRVPPNGITNRQSESFLGMGGQQVNLRVEVVPNEDGKRTVYMSCRTSRNWVFDVDDAKWVNGKVMIGEVVSGAKSQVSSNVDEPLVLLRLSEHDRTTKENPPHGLLVWISNARKP